MHVMPKRGDLTFDPAALLTLKVLAFLLMVLDHVDMFFGTGDGMHAFIGRIVFPIFGVIFAFNLARMDERKVFVVAIRLGAMAAVSQLLYAYLQGAWLPVNVLGTLASAALLYGAIRYTAPLTGLVVLCLSPVVDYSMWGVLGVTFLALAFRSGEPWRVHTAFLGFVLSLSLTNGTQWALLALPVVYLVAMVMRGHAPRWKALFYLGYPLHLAIAAAVKSLA